MNASNQHDVQLLDDYAFLKQFNIKTVRESIGWRLTENNNQFNWRALEHKAEPPKPRFAGYLDIDALWLAKLHRPIKPKFAQSIGLAQFDPIDNPIDSKG